MRLILSIYTGVFAVSLIPQLMLVFRKRRADQISLATALMTSIYLWIMTCVFLSMRFWYKIMMNVPGATTRTARPSPSSPPRVRSMSTSASAQAWASLTDHALTSELPFPFTLKYFAYGQSFSLHSFVDPVTKEIADQSRLTNSGYHPDP